MPQLRSVFGQNDAITSKEMRARLGKRAGAIGIFCNLLLALFKLTIGLLLGSVAITADGLNNLSDTAASGVAIVGFHLAQHPADRDHPYGHGRFEYLSALGVAVLILMMGLELIKASIAKIHAPEPITLAPIASIILLASVLIKLWMYFLFRSLGRRTTSSVLHAAAQDSRNDVVATTAVLAGYAIYYFFDLNFDGYIGLAVALFILYSGFMLAKETVSPLLGGRADSTLTDGIAALILSEERVIGIHDLLVHDYGPGQCYATVHVEISAEEDLLSCHAMIDRLEEKALARLNVHLVIHHDPVTESDEEQNRLRAMIEQLLAGIDAQLSIHDFRIVRSERGDRLIFDIAIPYAMLPQEENIRSALADALAAADYHGSTVIRFDAY